MNQPFIPPAEVAEDVRTALAEDIGTGDLTALMIAPTQQARGHVIARESAILCGQPWFDEAFKQVDPNVTITWHVKEGERIEPNQVLVEMHGAARSLVTAERTALNFLQLLSGTATTVNTYVQAIAGTKTRVVDSRKTIPGLRLAQKYAVRVGGGANHRVGLYDGILIKENHIAAAGSIHEVMQRAFALNCGKSIQIEVENLDQLKQALDANASNILLDNFDTELLKEAVTINKYSHKQAVLEASGGISLSNVREIALTGVDRISIGAITKNIQAVDLSMRMYSS